MTSESPEAPASAPEPVISVDRLEDWLSARGLLRVPIAVVPIGEGLSNFTYSVSDGDRTVVLRHPPPSRVGSNDLRREARFLSAVAGSGVPVPRVLAVAAPGEVMDVACYVMEHLDGEIVTDHLPAALDTPAEHRRIGEALVDVLAALAAADWSALADIARPDGFLERQLERMPRIIAGPDGTLPEAFARLRDDLAATLPESGAPGFVHGDLRLGNVMLSRTAPVRILGVLDWELAAVGDPLADLGYTLATYAVPGEEPHALTALSSPTLGAGFPDRAALAERYGVATGRDVSRLDWYQALATWKLAVLFEFNRRRHARGDGDPHYAKPGLVEGLLAATRGHLDGHD